MQIRDYFRPKCGSQRIKHRQHVNNFLTNRSGDWTQMTSSLKHHPGQAQDHAADSALESDGTHPSADVHEFIDFFSEWSIATRSAASAVTSLFCLTAIPTVAAIMAVASLILLRFQCRCNSQ